MKLYVDFNENYWKEKLEISKLIAVLVREAIDTRIARSSIKADDFAICAMAIRSTEDMVQHAEEAFKEEEAKLKAEKEAAKKLEEE